MKCMRLDIKKEDEQMEASEIIPFSLAKEVRAFYEWSNLVFNSFMNKNSQTSQGAAVFDLYGQSYIYSPIKTFLTSMSCSCKHRKKAL